MLDFNGPCSSVPVATDHEAQRQAARAARQELTRRGIQPAPKPRLPDAQAADDWQQAVQLYDTTAQGEPGSMTAWWQQFTAQADKAEAAIAAQRQAASDAGHPWPPVPHPDPAAGPAPELPGTLEPDPEPGQEPGHVDPA